MITERNDMRGTLTLRLTDRQEQIVHQARYSNLIVTTGRRLVAQLFAGQVGGPPPTQVSHMAVGTDATAPTAADAALGAERAPRKAISSVEYTDIAPDGTPRVRATLTSVFDFADANGAEPLREAGIFNADAGGEMYNRVVFDEVVKTSDFRLTLLWEIDF